MDVEGEGQEENVYRVPSPLTSQQQSQFVPRRTLPDDLEIRYPGSHPHPPCAATVTQSSLPASLSPLPSPLFASPSSPQYFNLDNVDPFQPDNGELLQPVPTVQPIPSTQPIPSVVQSLTNLDFEYSWARRDVVCLPSFLYQTPEPSDPG